MWFKEVFCAILFDNCLFFIHLQQNDTQNIMTLTPILFVFTNSVQIAQGPPPPQLAPPPPPGLPIDGLLILILLVGALYGIKKKLDHINTFNNL